MMLERFNIGRMRREKTGSSIHGIRLHEGRGSLKETRTNDGGFRRLNRSNLNRPKFVHKAQEVGPPLLEVCRLPVSRRRVSQACPRLDGLRPTKSPTCLGRKPALGQIANECGPLTEVKPGLVGSFNVHTF